MPKVDLKTMRIMKLLGIIRGSINDLHDMAICADALNAHGEGHHALDELITELESEE